MPSKGPYALSDFERRLKIGEGTYGVVYQCKNRITGEMKALKKIRLENDEEGVPATSIREMALLKELKHPNVVALEQVILENGKLYLVFEYVNEDLKKFLDGYRRKRIDPYIVQNFMYQMMQGLLFCHTRRILHRDLKPQNILVDKVNMVVKLADFGLARAYGLPIRPLTHEVVTLWYRAPEVLLGCQRYNCSLDVWSMGCIFIELAISEAIFRGDSEIDQLFAIFKILGTPDEETWPSLRSLQNYQGPTFPKWPDRLESHEKISAAFSPAAMDLLRKMLTYDPSTRINSRDVLLHKYFEDLEKKKLPAIGEEYVGLPADRIPPEIVETFRNPESTNIENLDPGTWLLGYSCPKSKLNSAQINTAKTENNDMSIDY